MSQYNSNQIRNVVLLSHSGAGKTSIVETMLFNAGAITRIGKVEDGSTISDYDPDEHKRRISINLSINSCPWKDAKLNLIDTPGYSDFIGEVKSGLRVAEGAVIVVCATSGVEVGTERAWEQTEAAQLPRLLFINKMDRENASFLDTMKQVTEKLDKKCIPIQLPLGSQKDFKGYIDVILKKAYTGNPLKEVDVPADIKEQLDSYHDKLIEAVVEVDDELLMSYLDGEEITTEQTYKCLKQATMQGKVVPVLAGSSLNNLCIGPLTDAIYNYLPSPVDRGAIKVKDATGGKEDTLEPDAAGPLAALAFKTTTDPHVGKITLFRVYSGSIESNSQVWNVNKGASERVGQLFSLRGKSQENTTKVIAGDIGAVAKLASTTTGDTLGIKEKQVKLEGIEFPEPVLYMAVFPKSKADLDKMSMALPRITEEDMTIKLRREADVGEMLIGGMGDTHLDVASDRLLRKFGVDVTLATPKVPYKETITVPVKTEYKHKKQTGGHGQYGHVLLEMEPLPKGTGFEFTDSVVGGSVPKNYIPAVEKGVVEAKAEGVLAKYPAVDIKVNLYDGSYHPVDSSEMAFKIASAQAFKKGMSQGKPVLLEPIMSMTITVPDNYTGDIIGDLNTKRARVQGMNPGGGINIIQAQAPMAEVQRYSIDLRSMTQGRGSFTIEFSHYEEVPGNIAQQVIDQSNQAKE